MQPRIPESDFDKGNDLPAPDGKYWTIKIDVAAWLKFNKFQMLPWTTVPSRRDSDRVICVFVFDDTAELRESLSEFWNPRDGAIIYGVKHILEFVNEQKACRHIKSSAEKPRG